ncbi:DUF2849 domain-containing protein [Xanthobacter sp. TB0139]|uniref:DUF2849 domain-containing protein n=1 Tax=Xanthobacter sp. TB0139 TaxID=3459178 RepID=UPI00403A69DC
MASPLQRKLKISGPTVVTANRLTDGAVVWLTANGSWSEKLADAVVRDTAEAVLDLLDLANGDESVAVGAYSARVTLDEKGCPQPGTLRERIRLKGPTAGPVLGDHAPQDIAAAR